MAVESKTRAEHIRGTISDLVSCFLYYDRKEDEDLPRGAIEEAIANGEITVDGILREFKQELIKGLGTK